MTSSVFRGRAVSWVVLAALGIGVLAGVLMVSHVTAHFRIVSSSMIPSIWPGDVVLAAKRAYAAPADRLPGDAGPQRGDIVVFRNPIDGRIYVKRVIGLPGERVGLVDGAVVINDDHAQVVDVGRYVGTNEAGRPVDVIVRDETLPDGVVVRVHHFEYGPGNTTGIDDREPVLIPAGRYFVLGDNRDLSFDSRWPQLVGLVRREDIIGRVDRIVVSATPAFRGSRPQTWLELRGDRFWLAVTSGGSDRAEDAAS